MDGKIRNGDEGLFNSFGEKIIVPDNLEENSNVSPDQREIFGNRGHVDTNVEDKLARYIYEFLNAKSNQMPTPEFVSHVREKAGDEKIYGDEEDHFKGETLISMGYGVEVTEGLKVNIRSLDSDIRFVITPEEYYRVGKDGKKDIILLEKDNEGGYDLGRVEALQEVLAKSKEVSKEERKTRTI